jgi:Flp pilus assembly protein TadG
MPEQLLHLRAAKRLWKEQQGSVLIEFAVSAVLVLTVLFMTLELCSAVYTYTVLADAANEGVRYAIVHSSDTSGAITKVKTYAAYTMHNVSQIRVSVTYPDGPSVPPNRVAVSVTYQYVPYVGAFMKNPPTMSAYAQGRLVY